MAPRSIPIAVAWLLGVFVVGCAGESDSTTRPTDALVTSTTEDPATVAPLNVDRYLLSADEGAGLHPLSPPQTVSGEPFPLPEGGAAVLERSGYISMTYQTGQGDSIAGVSSVLLFENEAGARDWIIYETSDEVLRHEPQTASSRGSRFPTFRARPDGRGRQARQRDRKRLLDPGPLHDARQYRN